MTTLKHGDFTGLAEDYAKFRPGYAPAVLDAIVGLLRVPVSKADAVDVGAGTGIWTRMLQAHGFASVRAVEPNAAMREQGRAHAQNAGIVWSEGSAEQTGLAPASADLLCMASSFHWANFDRAIAEFSRVLRPGGCFVALWNPRLLEISPLLTEIEAHLDTLRPGIKRVSSGQSGITATLTEQFEARAEFRDVLYVEGRHVMTFTPGAYIGVWRSVNDLRVQLGIDLFEQFLSFVERRIEGLDAIHATYRTRAWIARKC